MKRGFIAFLLLAVSAAAGAQSIYKSTMPDGKVVYGEKPAPGAKKVDKLEPASPSGVRAITPEEKARATIPAKQAPSAPVHAAPSANDARRDLEKAEAAREAGKEPLPGERLGTAKGGSRLSEDYYARQKRLEDAVTAARKRTEESGR